MIESTGLPVLPLRRKLDPRLNNLLVYNYTIEDYMEMKVVLDQ